MAVLRPTVATIHLDALEHNLRQLKAELKTGILAVVKANAYGHGVEWVAPALEAAGVDLFGVALIEEGLELRRLGIKTDILVMAGSFIRGEALCIEQRLTPMIGSLATLRAFDQAAAAQRTVLPIHLELDTGIHRLGFLEDDWPALFAELKNFRHLQVVGLASHFANADEPDSAYNAAQFARFSEALGELRLAKIDPPKWLHLSNSAAGLSHPAARYNLVRPGLTLYGYSPFTGVSKLALLPILEWSTEIVAIHELSAGQPVSYGGHFVTTRPSRIATLAVVTPTVIAERSAIAPL